MFGMFGGAMLVALMLMLAERENWDLRVAVGPELIKLKCPKILF